MFWKKKSIEDVVYKTKELSIWGVPFVIRKVNMTNYLDGSKVLLGVYQTYKDGTSQVDEVSQKKVMQHMKDVIMGAVVSPKLTREKVGDGFYVDDLFQDAGFAAAVYEEVVAYAYGKDRRAFFLRKRA